MRSQYASVTTRPPGAEVSQGSHASPQGKPSAEDLGAADINELAQQFSDVARALQAHHDTNEMLDEVVTSAAGGYQVVCVNTSKEVSTDDGCRDESAGAGRAGAGD